MSALRRAVHGYLSALAAAAVVAGALLALLDPVWGYSMILGAAIGLAPQWWAAWQLLREAPVAALGLYRIELGKWLLSIAAAAIAFRIEPLAPVPLFAALVLVLVGAIASVAWADHRHRPLGR